MSVVPLVSGGLDSTLMCVLAAEEGIPLLPLFVNYGQLAAKRELAACRVALRQHGLPEPEVVDVSGFGRLIPSGLTAPDKDVFLDAFLPGRNMLFLLMGAAYAYRHNADAVGIGLLSEETSLFPDQTKTFVASAENLLAQILERPMPILTPLMKMTKTVVVALAKTKSIEGTWSCHKAGAEPCGICIACREFNDVEA